MLGAMLGRRVLFLDLNNSARYPALAVGYHHPKRGTPEFFAMGLIDQLLLQGQDSRLYDAVVQKRGLAGSIGGGVIGMALIAALVMWVNRATTPATRESPRSSIAGT